MLVELQDRGETYAGSHEMTAEHFGITVTELEQIEREGLDKQWPPL